MGRLMAVDVGGKRIGVALSDELKIISSPYTTLNFTENFKSELQNIVKTEEVEKIIVGLPRNMDGTLGKQAEIVQEFTKKYIAGIAPYEYEDETLTTSEADAVLKDKKIGWHGRKQFVDTYAAKLILESYLMRISTNE